MRSVCLSEMVGGIAVLMYKTRRKRQVMNGEGFEELYLMPAGVVDD